MSDTFMTQATRMCSQGQGDTGLTPCPDGAKQKPIQRNKQSAVSAFLKGTENAGF